LPLKKKRFSVELTVSSLKRAEVGVRVAELIRKVGSASRHLTGGRGSVEPGLREFQQPIRLE
jgi:hypothetical protein